jgi:hypothetical protein
VQFPLDQPLPRALIRKIVAERVRLSIEEDGKWKTAKSCQARTMSTVR